VIIHTFKIRNRIYLAYDFDELLSQSMIICVIDKNMALHLLSNFNRLQLLFDFYRPRNLLPRVCLNNHEFSHIYLEFKILLPVHIWTRFYQNLQATKLSRFLFLKCNNSRLPNKFLNRKILKFAAFYKIF
jgi:hypothetical protein